MRVVFFDFSSTFNTLRPHTMRDKLLSMVAASSLTYLDYRLFDCQTTVCQNGEMCFWNTGMQYWGSTGYCFSSFSFQPLGTLLVLDDKLKWSANIDTVYRKGQSRLFFLRWLRSFNVCSDMLCMFYHTVIESALFYAVVCWQRVGQQTKTVGAWTNW